MTKKNWLKISGNQKKDCPQARELLNTLFAKHDNKAREKNITRLVPAPSSEAAGE